MKPRIKFCFDYGCDPFWSDDDLSVELYGISNIDIKDLNLSEKTLNSICVVAYLNDTYLNPLYQCFPSFWRTELCDYYNQSADKAYLNSCLDLGDRVELVKGYSAGITEDERLAFFLSDPVEYCLQKRISFGDPAKFKAEVREEEEAYLQFTGFVLSGKFEETILSGKKLLKRDRMVIGLDKES